MKHSNQMEGIKLGIKWNRTKQIPGAEENPGSERKAGLSNMDLNEANLKTKRMGVNLHKTKV